MAIDIAKQHVAVITITDDDIVTFLSLITKLNELAKKPGFKKPFNTKELGLINEINENLSK